MDIPMAPTNSCNNTQHPVRMPGMATVESSAKRRKLGHTDSGVRQDALIDFKSRQASKISTASAFVLQAAELLKENKLDYGRALGDVDVQLHKLRESINAIEPHDPIPLWQASSSLEKQHRINIPYPDPKPPEDAHYKLAFEKPAQYNVVGSYVSKTMVKAQERVAVDMVVQMPKALFQEKDYLDMRYFYRRAYYIAYIAAHVQKPLEDSMRLSFENLHDNPLLPVLVLKPKTEIARSNGSGKASHKKSKDDSDYAIRLIPCAPEETFPTSKLGPLSRNIRAKDDNGEKELDLGTPFYNSTLTAETTFISYLRLLVQAQKSCPSFGDACMLGRTWLQQRGFGGSVSQGGFGHFEWALMTALLLQTGGRGGKPALSTSLSATELFKAALQFLANTDLNKKPFNLGRNAPEKKKWRDLGPVLFDVTRNLNIVFKMGPWSADLLRMHAKSATDLLSDDASSKFEPLFIVNVNASLQIFDVIFEIKGSDISKLPPTPDKGGTTWNASQGVYKTLKKAYGNRARLINIRHQRREMWSVGKTPALHDDRIVIGVVFEPSQMPRQMEYGPPAEEKEEADKFRQFWGEKAELRRFKDGSILECVEWSFKLPAHICAEIARYILKRHFNIRKDDISFYGEAFSSIINFTNLDKDAFDAVRSSFQTFEHDIRALEDLPLSIRQLSPVSSLSRYASVRPPMPGFHKDSIDPMDVGLFFEASNRWPENLVAIQEAKIEFLLDIDRRLTQAHKNITTYLGRENRDVGIENLAYLDVVYENGAAFRLRVHCDMEETLLQRQVSNKTLDGRTRDEAEQALTGLKWQFDTLPSHTATIATFCTRLPALSPTIRLVKHWFDCHKLSRHISEELVELFVLHVFLQPYPWQIPSSPATGLLQTLGMLSRWDWREVPLIVDSAESLTAAERADAHKHLEDWRRRDPHMNRTVLIVATSHDQSGLGYTRGSPSKLIASRMTRLAKAACKIIKDQDYHIDASQLFQPSLRDYDVLIHLSTKAFKAVLRDAATTTGARKQSQFKNLDDRTGTVPLPVRQHPADVLLDVLRAAYEDTTLIFFFRGAGAAGAATPADDGVIGAIWNPKLQRQKFRPGLQYNFASVLDGADSSQQREEGDDVVEVNRRAVLLEIARIGGDMIRKIEEVDEE